MPRARRVCGSNRSQTQRLPHAPFPHLLRHGTRQWTDKCAPVSARNMPGARPYFLRGAQHSASPHSRGFCGTILRRYLGCFVISIPSFACFLFCFYRNAFLCFDIFSSANRFSTKCQTPPFPSSQFCQHLIIASFIQFIPFLPSQGLMGILFLCRHMKMYECNFITATF